ncbi:hypothetical protein GCM10022399_16700 [Terrabacter ginsenosidimutans]|jgi:hypothetical protein|uniref:Uncharacterized protein n=1 Tax=Terrabacter ginsenosidimutans TaxID=490575 RepID=A0ABP7D4Q9_9MICO
MTASPAYVFAAADVLVEPEDPEDPEDVVLPVVLSVGCWPEESVAEADEDPDVDPVLSELLLVVVTVRVSAATRADELREVL